MKNTVYTLYDLVSEMESFLPVSKKDLEMAKESKVTTNNNTPFAQQVRMWSDGQYDESPEQFLYTIINIGETFAKSK